jgi:hypothetical protein
MFTAVMNNDLTALRASLLSESAKQEINWQDRFGFTVLHVAVSKVDINVDIIKVVSCENARIDPTRYRLCLTFRELTQALATKTTTPLFTIFVKNSDPQTTVERCLICW